MISKVFAVRDTKAENYFAPWFFIQPGQALRQFSDLVNDDSTMLARHPADYSLYEVGEWDDLAGLLSAVNPPKFLCCGSDFKVKPLQGVTVNTEVSKEN